MIGIELVAAVVGVTSLISTSTAVATIVGHRRTRREADRHSSKNQSASIPQHDCWYPTEPNTQSNAPRLERMIESANIALADARRRKQQEGSLVNPPQDEHNPNILVADVGIGCTVDISPLTE